MTRLSQHLTIDKRVLERIVELANPSASDVVLEPGCGDGRLTELLAERGCRLLAVEIDPRLAAEARWRLRGWPNVEVVTGDVLELNPEQFTMIVGNPPYHISRPLIEWIVSRPTPRRVVMTLQREFARKLSSQPGYKDYLYISLLSQLFYQIEVLDTIPPSAFKPRPRVASSIVRLQRNEQTPLEADQLRLLKQIFTDRRHVLGKVLKKMGYEPPREFANKRIYHLTTRDALSILTFLNTSRA
ncbi:MAG: 16S rRNA (adenine(1518)-N(6)/adenine(1519)-N(6))-dimethyltransferase RsmA [Nitrososphaerota archaeon]